MLFNVRLTTRILPSLLTPRASLLCILFVFTALTLYNSVLLPLGEADDETDHYQYLRFVARAGHPPFTAAERDAAGFKGGLAPLYYWLTAWPIALVGEDMPPDIRRVDARPERYIPTDGLGINRVLHTLDEQFPWRGQVLAWRLVRLLSLPMAWVTILATYALAHRLLPQRKIVAIGAAAFVAFLPRFIISSAVINDDNLVFALTALLLLSQISILQGDRRPRTFALFGALFGLSLVTKYFSLILIPEIILTLVVAGNKVTSSKVASNKGEQPPNHPTTLLHSPLFAFLMALILTAGPWYTFIVVRFNRINELGLIPGLAASLGEPQITEGLVGLFAGHSVRPPAATYALPDWLSLLYRSFWFEYGWMQIFAPTWVYGVYAVILILALIGLVWQVTSDKYQVARSTYHASRITHHVSRITPPSFLLSLHLLLFLVVVLARYILSATIDTGQGRHLYPALPVIALLFSLGLSRLYALRSTLSPLPSTVYRLRSTVYLLPATCYLALPFILQPSVFILPRYPTLPITTIPPTDLPITYRQTIPLDGFSLAGFDTAAAVSAGNTLPVTLYWRIDREVNQDFLVSLCLQDDEQRPVGCWRGHFANGDYPARAWESGDTLADTVFIPIPACYRLYDKKYTLHLELWPLDPTSAIPQPMGSPVLSQTFASPRIAIQATDLLFTTLPQKLELWQANRRLTAPVNLKTGQTLTQITYTNHQTLRKPPALTHIPQAVIWFPLTDFQTNLYLPCADGPTPFARLSHFIVNPTLVSGVYQANNTSLPPLTLSLRDRVLAPLTSTLTFSHTLAPLSRQPFDNHLTTQPPYALRPTIHWQAHRWMADPLIISLKLLDKDFAIGAERIATLGDRYPNVLWAPGEIVEETYPLQFKPDTPPGLYRLELSLLRQDKTLPDGFEYLPLLDNDQNLGHNLYPLTIRLLDPAQNTPPPYPAAAHLGESIELTGYNLDPKLQTANVKSAIKLALYWRNTNPLPADYTVFTQLLGPDGQVWAQWDNPPQAGRYPTPAWTANDTVIDRYNLTLRDGAPPGDYRLLVGMYDPATGQRLPVTVNGQPQPDNALQLTTFTVSP